MSSDLEKELKRWIDISAGLILAICAISLVVILIVCVCKKQQIPVEHTIDLRVAYDSIPESIIDKSVVDSINSIITQHENSLKEHYRYLLEKRDWDDSIITVGSLLVGIIISILGFFGFRSFKSIEEKATLVAEEKTLLVAKSEAIRYLDSNLEDVIFKKHIRRISDEVSASLKDGIFEDFRSDIDSIKDVIERVENNHEDIEGLQIQMRSALSEIEKLSKKKIEIKVIESSAADDEQGDAPANPFTENNEA